MMYAVALGGVVNLLWVVATGATGEAQRIALADNGAISNANDLAAHLLLVMAFVLFVALVSKRWAIQAIAFTVFSFGLYYIVRTGSRGALIALMLSVLFIFLRAPAAVRLSAALAIPVAAVVLIALLPRDTLVRYATTFSNTAKAEEGDDPADTKGAEASTRAKTYLLETSALYSIEHPLFGVGPGEFEDQEAAIAKESNRHAAWQVPHNSYTQISSEAGIPAFVFQVAALIGTFAFFCGSTNMPNPGLNSGRSYMRHSV